MTVISVSIEQSSEQIVAGIPKTIAITANVSAIIFYTLDGTVPNLYSTIYTGPIFLPTDQLAITVNVFANNGIESSPIISETYITNILQNTRLPHSATDAAPGTNIPNLYPFGTNPLQPTTTFLSPGDSGITVNNPDLSTTNTGYDGAGNETGFTNEPYTIENYQISYTEKNRNGEIGLGIGNLPASVRIKLEEPIPEQTNQFSTTFDPRAFVIFQDFDKENPDDPPQINRQFFTLENGEKARDGNAYFNTGLDSPPVSGSFVRSHYNPRTNEIKYYYFDSWTNKWIISTQQYVAGNGTFDGNLSGMASGRGNGSQYIFEWVPFARRVLF